MTNPIVLFKIALIQFSFDIRSMCQTIKEIEVNMTYRWFLGDGIPPATPYKRPTTKEGFYRKYEYVYDEYYNCYICLENQISKYTTTNREGYREYKSNPKICINCPSRYLCTKSKNHTKLVTRHIWDGYMEMGKQCPP